MRVTTVEVLNAPQEHVWDVLTDWERQASWMPDVAWIRVLSPERQLNARMAVRTKVFGVPLLTDSFHVVVWDRPRRLVVRHVGLVRGSGEWLLDRRGHRTWFRWTEDLMLPIPVIGALVLRAYRSVLRWTFLRSVRSLRRQVEQQV